MPPDTDTLAVRGREELFRRDKVLIDLSLASLGFAEVLVETHYEHIVLNKDHVPSIAGTTMKVVELVVEQHACGCSPEQLHFQHPYLTLGQIHSALAYYCDHQEELDLDIRRRLERVEELRSELQHPESWRRFGLRQSKGVGA